MDIPTGGDGKLVLGGSVKPAVQLVGPLVVGGAVYTPPPPTQSTSLWTYVRARVLRR